MADQIKTLARDENCDLFVDASGNLAIATGMDAYVQIVNAKMRTVLGELPMDVNGGLPYFQTVFADPSTIDVFEAEAVKMLEAIEFVESVKSFTCEVKGDVLYYTAEIITDKGALTVNG